MSQKKTTLSRKIRRWKRRMMKKYPWTKSLFPVAEAVGGFLLVLALAGALLWAFLPKGDGRVQIIAADMTAAPTQVVATPTPTVEAPVSPTETPVPMPTTEPSATPSPEPTPLSSLTSALSSDLYLQTAGPVQDYSDPSQNNLITKVKVYNGSQSVNSFARSEEIHMGSSESYASVEGVTTFRGTNYREGSSYGTIPENPKSLKIIWSKKIGGLDEWGGVGWTGQASAVRWSDEVRQMMNITSEKKAKDDLIEIIYATLDGKIYFLDMEDGKATRDPIKLGAPIKGSVTVDPRGYPLLYCGQGIYDVNGKRLKCGTRIWSLVDQSLLYFLDGKDDVALRAWRAFDGAPMVDGATDTMVTAGENGVLYTVKLNTQLTDSSISVKPEVQRYVYTQKSKEKVGSENSVAIYNNYVYFGTNAGLIQCVDLNTMQLVWTFDTTDDIDATLAIEVEEDGLVALYGINELDNRGKSGRCQMFKFNALTGELLWVVHSDKIYQNNENGGGGFASPAIGKGDLSHLVFFNACRIVDNGSILYALDKETGETVWTHSTKRYSWSSPVCVYTESGKGYVFIANSSGTLRLLDGLTGKSVASVDLESNVEGTPVVFDDLLVVGTRGRRIYGVKIQ